MWFRLIFLVGAFSGFIRSCARCSELVETFTFLKYKYGENIVLNVEIGEFSICGYVGDNLEC